MNHLSKLCLMLLVLGCVASLTTPALADEIKGNIKEVNADQMSFVLKTNSGLTQACMLDEDADVLINGQKATLVDLRPGDAVTVLYRQEGDLWLVIEVRCRGNSTR